MNRHQNSERHHTTNKTNSFHFEDAYVNLAYENNSDSPDDTQQNSDDPQMNKIQEMGSVLTNNGKHKKTSVCLMQAEVFSSENAIRQNFINSLVEVPIPFCLRTF